MGSIGDFTVYCAKIQNVFSLRSFEIGKYFAIILVIVSALYTTRSFYEHVKKKRQSNNQVAPIPTVSASVGGQGENQVPQIQLNNNQFNPEVIDSKHLYIFVALFFFLLCIFFYSNIQVIIWLFQINFIQAISLTFLLSYPYVTNERLRRFIIDEYFN